MSSGTRKVRVLGDLDAGLIIEAERPSHLPGPTQRLLLTPDTAIELIERLCELKPPRTIS